MKTIAARALLTLMFGVGCGLFFYGLTDFSGYSQALAHLEHLTNGGITGSYGWSSTGRYCVAVGSFLIGIPIAFRFTR